MAQRYPADFDGIVSVVPVINWVGLQFAGTRTGLVQMDGGWLSPAKVKLLHEAVLKTCDAQDGLADGIVGRTDVCIRAMNPKALRCADGRTPAIPACPMHRSIQTETSGFNIWQVCH